MHCCIQQKSQTMKNTREMFTIKVHLHGRTYLYMKGILKNMKSLRKLKKEEITGVSRCTSNLKSVDLCGIWSFGVYVSITGLALFTNEFYFF